MKTPIGCLRPCRIRCLGTYELSAGYDKLRARGSSHGRGDDSHSFNHAGRLYPTIARAADTPGASGEQAIHLFAHLQRARVMDYYPQEYGGSQLGQKSLLALFRNDHRIVPEGQPPSDRCGARTRAGHPCKRKGNGAGGRCANHGGASTGPRSKEGRARISRAQKKRWRKWRAQHR